MYACKFSLVSLQGTLHTVVLGRQWFVEYRLEFGVLISALSFTSL